MALSDWFLTPAERRNEHTVIDAVRDGQRAYTTGNSVRPVVHGGPYFAELATRITEMGEGDRIYFVDWRGDPDQRLNDDGDTLVDLLEAALGRGVDVRGLLWRSHWRKFGFHSERAFTLSKRIEAAGGQCLRDMRVRTAGSHHQKFVVLRHHDDPARDIAYVGGIDLCHSRRDDDSHGGDEQALHVAAEYGPRPAWHDVQVAITGPAVYDVETTFRERWEDSTPLTLNPGRALTSWLQAEDQDPKPLGEQWPPPEPAAEGNEAVQILRTYPPILPKGYDFAPEGEQSIVHANAKAMANARRLVYVEDQYLWGKEVGEHFAAALRDQPDLRLVLVLPLVPDVDAIPGRSAELNARRVALEPILAAGGDRVAVFSLTNESGLPVYVHSKVCIIDDRWASVGSDNFNRRSWSSDSELATAVMDARRPDRTSGESAPDDSFPVRLRRTLCAEHLGISEDEVPDDPIELFDALVACADDLDNWYSSGAASSRGRVLTAAYRVHDRRRRLPGAKRRHRQRVADAAAAGHERSGGADTRPPGRLRALGVPDLSRAKQTLGQSMYALIDPDGTITRDESLAEQARPDAT